MNKALGVMMAILKMEMDVIALVILSRDMCVQRLGNCVLSVAMGIWITMRNVILGGIL